MKTKKLLTYLLLLGVGLLLGYFLFCKKEFFIISPSLNSMTNKIEWAPIKDSSTAAGWINNYRKEADGLWYPLRVSKDTILKGFWIDRKMIETMFKQDSAAVNGIRIYFAQKDPTLRRTYNLVFVATKHFYGKPKLDPNGNDDFGGYFDYVDPCPNNCGSTGN